jgi:uncharacterized protein (DUF302 family)
MVRAAGIFVTGVVVGLLLMGIFVYAALPRLMFTVNRSTLDFDTTVLSIEKAAVSCNWKVPEILDLQQVAVSAGHSGMTPVKVISLCHPDYAYRLLRSDRNKAISGIMPCRVAVYETAEGEVFISKLNLGLLGSLFGGDMGQTIHTVSAEQKRMFSHLYAPGGQAGKFSLF